MGLNRASISIAGTRLTQNEFTEISLRQDIHGHHVLECTMRRDTKLGYLKKKCGDWIGEPLIFGVDLVDFEAVESGFAKDIFCGIVISVGEHHQRGAAETVVKAYSPTYAMDGHKNTRSFTDMSLQAIVDEVTGPYNGMFKEAFSVSPQIMTSTIPYCVQYDETDYQFLSRLASYYGEWFFYDGCMPIFGMSSPSSKVVLDMESKALDYFDVQVMSKPVGFEVRAYDYKENKFYTEENPEKPPGNTLASVAFDKSKANVFTQKPIGLSNSYTKKAELKDKAERMEAIGFEGSVIAQGQSRNPQIRVGCEIYVKDAAYDLSHGSFVVISVDHAVTQRGNYYNVFTAIPIEEKSPPTGSQLKMPVAMQQKAKVVDVNDEDGLGRVKVEFAWQQGTGQTSPWIRVLTNHAGKPKGFYFNPEVDDLVWVDFERSNPAMPYVCGAFYHKDAEPSYFHPKNKKKGWKTKGGNSITLDDAASHITVSAPKEITLTASDKITLQVGEYSVTLDKDGLFKIVCKDLHGDYTNEAIVKGGRFMKLMASQKLHAYSDDLVEVSSTNTAKMNSMSVDINGTVTCKAAGAASKVELSAAMAEVKGPFVKLNC